MITVRISFEKKNEASYISLLDLQRVMQRVLKRSGLPVWHTLGDRKSTRLNSSHRT